MCVQHPMNQSLVECFDLCEQRNVLFRFVLCQENGLCIDAASA